jgi:hypothetical protein
MYVRLIDIDIDIIFYAGTGSRDHVLDASGSTVHL